MTRLLGFWSLRNAQTIEQINAWAAVSSPIGKIMYCVQTDTVFVRASVCVWSNTSELNQILKRLWRPSLIFHSLEILWQNCDIQNYFLFMRFEWSENLSGQSWVLTLSDILSSPQAWGHPFLQGWLLPSHNWQLKPFLLDGHLYFLLSLCCKLIKIAPDKPWLCMLDDITTSF